MDFDDIEIDKQQDTIFRQYEQIYRDIWKLDQDYIKITTLYIVIISAYIGTFRFWSPARFSIIISVLILFFGICILGIIYRTQKLIDQRIYVAKKIEMKLPLQYPVIKGIGIRTSTYLMIIVFILTIFAIFLTYSMRFQI